jgi:hypothetical protein
MTALTRNPAHAARQTRREPLVQATSAPTHFTYPAHSSRCILGQSYCRSAVSNPDLAQTIRYNDSISEAKAKSETYNPHQRNLVKPSETQ